MRTGSARGVSSCGSTDDIAVPIAELARLTDRTPATTQRQQARILASGARHPLRLGFPDRRPADLLLRAGRVGPTDRAATITQLRRLRQLWMCLSVTGSVSLVFTSYTRTVAELARFEGALGTAVPGLEVLETMIHLRTRKTMGLLIAPDGRATGEEVVPTSSQVDTIPAMSR